MQQYATGAAILKLRGTIVLLFFWTMEMGVGEKEELPGSQQYGHQ